MADASPAQNDQLQRVHLNPDEPDRPYQLYGVGPVPPKKEGVVRVWVDGCFDMLHFGHTNALRQARALGHELFVGCHSDEEIKRHKGPPIMNAQERYEALRACKWVTYVVEDYPYCTELRDMKRFGIDFAAHGDDISTGADGRNSYQELIDADCFRVFKRTSGISTTDLVGRMLLCTKSHHADDQSLPLPPPKHESYLTSNSKIVQFSNRRAPEPTDKIVYVDGAFDLFHIGHMRVLKKAREFGTYLVVGIHSDQVINEHKGSNFPIMNLNERVLGVLSCEYVDEVIMGVPFEVAEEVIKNFNVSVVVAGEMRDGYDHSEVDPYKIPKAMGIYREVKSDCNLTVEALIGRIVAQHQAFLERQAKKAIKDKAAEEKKPEIYQNVQEVQ